MRSSILIPTTSQTAWSRSPAGLTMPNGVAFRDGNLYVAEINRLLRFDDVESHLESPTEPVVLNDGLPTERPHGWKYLGFGPDGKLYVPVGAPCNICDRTGEDSRFGTILRMNPDGTGEEIFARGIRNSVGFDWQPGTDELWFTNNGRDRLGDETPPDTLHHAPEAGLHFGYPFCHGGDLQDPEFSDRPCEDFRPPARKLGPHVASIGMKFYTGSMFPPEYHNQIFIAEHGSRNRSSEAGHTGYRLTVVHVDGDRAGEYETFADGWVQTTSRGGVPPTCWSCPMARCLFPTTRRTRSTASPTTASCRFSWYRRNSADALPVRWPRG